MSIAALDLQLPGVPRGVLGGARSAGGQATTSVLRRLAWCNSLIDKLLADASDPEQVVTSAEVAEVDRASRRLEAVKLALIAKAERQEAHRATGATSTSAWIAGLTQASGAGAAQQVALAAALEGGLESTRSAVRAGRVPIVNAAIIADTMARLPEGLTGQDRVRVEEALVRDAAHLAPGSLRKAATVALGAAARSAAEVAQHQEDVLVEQERRAYAASCVTIHHRGDGSSLLRATLPTGPAKMLEKVLQTMTAPRRDHLRKAVQDRRVDGVTLVADVRDGSVAAGLAAEIAGGREGSERPGVRAGHDGSPGRNDDWASLDWSQKKGRALVDILEHLDTERLTGKVASTVIVTMTLEQVLGAARLAELAISTAELSGGALDLGALPPSVGAAGADTGHLHSTSDARRLACNAGILPVVLSGAGLPLDLGRADRFFTDTQRTALAAVDDECAADGCDRPYAWCELHHENPWSAGGLTDLRLAIPLCGAHHRQVHDPSLVHTMATSGARKTVRFRLRQ